MNPYFSFQWHITDECDQRCRHCYIFSAGNADLRTAPVDEMARILENCLSMCGSLGRTPYFYITGGDPILNPHFWDLTAMLHDAGVRFTVMGNPFHLTSDACQHMREDGCEKYQLSIDGLRETHDAIRRPGSFDETLKAIGTLRSAGIRTAVMTTVSQANVNEVPSIIDLVVDCKVDVFAFARYCPDGDGFSDLVTPERYRELLETCWERFVRYRSSCTSFNLKDHLWTPFLYEKGRFRLEDYPDDGLVYEGCNCGVNHLTILPNGDVYACRRMDSKVGNALESSIEEIFLGADEDAYRDVGALRKCSRCKLLRFCRGCPAVAAGATGDRLNADPQCWVDVESDMYRVDSA